AGGASAARERAAVVKVAAIALAATLASCHDGIGDRDVPAPHLAANVVARLERQPCYGWWPVYVVTVFGDGRGQEDGERFGKTIGHRDATLPAETLAEIQRFFDAHDFWTLDDRYLRYDVTDERTVILTGTSSDGRTKSVRHYHGDRSAPTRLVEIED